MPSGLHVPDARAGVRVSAAWNVRPKDSHPHTRRGGAATLAGITLLAVYVIGRTLDPRFLALNRTC